MRDHDLRRRAVGEMHLRRWPLLPVPCLIVQWILLLDAAERSAERELLLPRSNPEAVSDNPSHLEGELGPGIRFAWERHSEGSSFSLFCTNANGDDFVDPFRNPPLAKAIRWAESLPGDVVRSTRIWIAATDADAEKLLPALYLNTDELVSCHIGGAIRMWSDFRLKDDGFGRLLLAANGADRRDVTRQVQRLQELGNYRNRALLGLPIAQRYWPQLDAAEDRLRTLAARVADSDERDDALLDSLTVLSLELATISTAIDFRMDATKAYAQLVEERLEQVDGRPIDGFASLADFTQRRFRPAINTCLSTTHRVTRLAVRAEQLSSLLRARIETRIENQNAQLLRSMERSVSMQVRLQQLVEGLSVVALSYYLLGLIAYVLKGLPEGALGIGKDVLLAILVVPLMGLIWLVTTLVKKRLLHDQPS
ncbi:DUF3422 domain-containing protein [Sphingomonas jaspsi]|uniref:DUF3422 domain-containing protein n=1 Tax=Sphingomonas jaspsi TaxID=392409 RepID=UPI0004B03CC0|nr:DUF3422 domain-containing protein [Sphingomonas jaspsi]